MQIGDRIPENLGIDQDGNEIKRSDYRGQVDVHSQLQQVKDCKDTKIGSTFMILHSQITESR